MENALPESDMGAGVPNRSPVSNIVLPLDGSEIARVAIPVVRGLVRLFEATPHLVHAGKQTLDPEQWLAKLGVQWDELPGAIVNQSPSPAPEMILRLGKELPRSLIVMCTHTGHNRDPNNFGSVTEAVLAGNPERVVLVTPELRHETFNISRILLAHDGTPSAAVAAGPASEIARRAYADVIAVHIAAPRVGCPQESGSLPAPQYVDQPQHEWPSWTSEFGARMLALGAPASSLKFEVVVAGGQPGSEVARLARTRKVDLVVMANSGNWEGRRHNCVRAVIQTSGCPVLLVRSESSQNP